MDCPECGFKNRAGTLFCEDCGYLMFDQDAIPTKKLKKSRHNPKGNDVEAVILHLRELDQHIPIRPGGESVIGRTDTDTQEKPEIDLLPYQGLEKGVSRRHATLDCRENAPKLTDLGSSNGTFVNGQKLTPHVPCVLNDGDEIRMGRLVTRIYLQYAEPPETPGAPQTKKLQMPRRSYVPSQ